MTHSPSLQSMQAAAKLPSHVLLHTQPHGNVGFAHSIAILANRRERNAHDSILLLDLRHQIDVKGVGAIVKDNEPFAVMFDFADCADHREGTQA